MKRQAIRWMTAALLVGGLTGPQRTPAAELPADRPLAIPAAPAPQPAETPDPPCDDGAHDVPEVVDATARQLTALHIAYQSQPLSDCSGMFHRVLASLTRRCDDVLGPTPEEARSSRAIAQWYDARGALVRVSTPESADPFLEPGAVLFFATPSTAHAGDLARIHHVGVLVDLERDASGHVQSYRLFHGRQPGLTATISDRHTRDNRPPLGNGPDALVAIAWLEEGEALALR